MSDESKTTPPAGGLSEAQLASALTAALKPTQDLIAQQAKQIEALTQNQKALQESAKTPALKAEDLAKAIGEQLDTRQKAQATETAKSQAKEALRAKVVAARLPGVPKGLLAALPDTDDEAALTTAADALRKEIESVPGVKLADVGGAAKDGGTTPAAAAQATGKGGFLKMPD